MKCIILSAGLGSRAKPLTNAVPKVMLKIGGKPLLEHQIILCRKYGIKEIAVNLHYKPRVITNYFQNGNKWGVKLNYSYEKKLLGTAGALKKLVNYWNNQPFLMLYGDNFTSIDLSKIIKFSRKKRAACHMTLFESKEPWTQGVVKTDNQGRVIEFQEKPAKAKIVSSWVDAGVSIFHPKILEYIPSGKYFDLGKNFFPLLIKKKIPIYTLKVTDYIQDIGSPKRYQKAKRDLKKGIAKLP